LRARAPPGLDELHPLKQFRAVKDGTDIIPRAESYLRTHGDNHRRKTVQIHQDWEECYMQPIHGRMRHRLNGRPYSAFRSARTQTLSELELQSGGPPSGLGSGPLYNALEDDDSIGLPYVKIGTSGLDDRIHKYQRHVRTEKRLTGLIKESHGIRDLEPKVPERNTLDLEGWKTLQDTRIFAVDAGGGRAKGRRPFAEILNSRIDEAMGHF
jgi:hypothetical protein